MLPFWSELIRDNNRDWFFIINDILIYKGESTKDKNVIRGTGVAIGGTNNLIDSKNQFTALVGVSGMAVIATSDAILVVPKDKAEQVKDVVDYLEKHNKDELL